MDYLMKNLSYYLHGLIFTGGSAIILIKIEREAYWFIRPGVVVGPKIFFSGLLNGIITKI